MNWSVTSPQDAALLSLADRHYSRRKPGTSSFVPSARCVALKTDDGRCGWVSVWFSDRQVTSPWTAETWVCSFFRNESDRVASVLIREAVAATRWVWGDPPANGMTTFVDAHKVASEVPGYVFRRSKFAHIGETSSGLLVLRMSAARVPAADQPHGLASLWPGDPHYVQPSRRSKTGIAL